MSDLHEAALDTITYHEGRDYNFWQNSEWIVGLDLWGSPAFFFSNKTEESETVAGNLYCTSDPKVLDQFTIDGAENLPQGVIKICEKIGYSCG